MVSEYYAKKIAYRSLTVASWQAAAPALSDRATDKSSPSCGSCAWLSACLTSDFVSVPPTPLPTNDVDVYFETSADDNEHARFQKAKEQLEIRHRNRMDRVIVFVLFVVLGIGSGPDAH